MGFFELFTCGCEVCFDPLRVAALMLPAFAALAHPVHRLPISPPGHRTQIGFVELFAPLQSLFTASWRSPHWLRTVLTWQILVKQMSAVLCWLEQWY
jgi:hypothetical protein